jgi:hypothetical protein
MDRWRGRSGTSKILSRLCSGAEVRRRTAAVFLSHMYAHSSFPIDLVPGEVI